MANRINPTCDISSANEAIENQTPERNLSILHFLTETLSTIRNQNHSHDFEILHMNVHRINKLLISGPYDGIQLTSFSSITPE